MNHGVGVRKPGHPCHALQHALHRLIQMLVLRDALTSQSCPANKQRL
jgi:hypothetical protein